MGTGQRSIEGQVGPTRTCVGCRREGPKAMFLRIVRTPEGDVKLDVSGTAPGRGAYVCRDTRCADLALRRDRLARALRARPGPQERERLEEALAKGIR